MITLNRTSPTYYMLEYLKTFLRAGNTMHVNAFWSLLLAASLLSPSIAAAQEKKPTAAAIQFFETKVRPVLVDNCYECHAGKKHKGGLQVDSLTALLEGGDQGPAIVP